MSALRRRPLEACEPLELVDLPAAVLCVRCGSSECPGCEPERDQADAASSGLHRAVPWERAGAGLWQRLWATTRASTEGAEGFFGQMPEGPIGPALRFAVLAELVAVGSSVACYFALGLSFFGLLFPSMTRLLLGDPACQLTLVRMVAAAWGAFTLVLVSCHLLHGAMLDLMARRAGAPGALGPALRFGLYAAGWDVATSPFGLLVALGSSGVEGLKKTRTHAFRTPGLSTGALLRGLYRLEGEPAARVRARSMAVTMAASMVAIALACGAVIWSF